MRPLSQPRRAAVLRLPLHSAQPPPSPPPPTLRHGESTSRSRRGGSIRRIHAPDRAAALPDRSISIVLAVDAHVLLKDGRLRAPPPSFPSSLTASHMALGSSRSSAGRVGASAAQVQDPASAAGRDLPDQRKVFRVTNHAGVALAGLTAIFLHELQPILANHLQTQTATTGNACVVACSAAAAKDHLFKGSQEQPGLVTITMEEILRFVASVGGAVWVSSYQAHVKSVEDFARLGCFNENQDKQQPAKASSTQHQPTKLTSFSCLV
ncbi:hypothetical protein VPH35_001711 [Triticum aestivum]|uniref:uncharacterized protein isoform X2 n=2 Tax=Triticum TaxID=4564 RepID=UPI001D030250|nr:uncharacterized protein LOC123043079 isoform X2 [Triticum aestivum]XP_044321382.1 uncharacterized protein LOC123043079 isoform X2 [Triticum aestivum]